jgi:hypothetical protein
VCRVNVVDYTAAQVTAVRADNGKLRPQIWREAPES